MPEYQEKLLSLLQQACEYFSKSPDLVSLQLLGSVDGLSCVTIGNWLNEHAIEQMQTQDPFLYMGKYNILYTYKHASPYSVYYFQIKLITLNSTRRILKDHV